MKWNVALLQIESHRGDLSYNRRRAEEMFRQAMAAPVRPDLVMLSETWTSPYGPGMSKAEQAAAYGEAADGESLTMLRALAKEYGVWICAGSITLWEPGQPRAFNTMFLLDRAGQLVARYDKVHLCDWAKENEAFASGDASVTVDTELGKMGLAICYDVRFPEFLRLNVKAGAQILLLPACFGTSLNHWRLLVQARAVENQVFVLGCNGCGGKVVGHSMVVAPDGEILAEAESGETILTATIDLDRIAETRKKVTYVSDRREELYRQYT